MRAGIQIVANILRAARACNAARLGMMPRRLWVWGRCLGLLMLLAGSGLAQGSDGADRCVAPPTDWRVGPLSGVVLEGAAPGRRGYRPLAEGDLIPPGALLRSRPEGLPPDAPPVLLHAADSAVTLEIHRGAVLRRGAGEWRPLLGRFRVAIADKPTTARRDKVHPLAIRFPTGRLEINAGEALFEIDGHGNGSMTLRRGRAWLKTVDRSVIRLEPGKQIDLPRWGTPGRPRNADARWAEPSRGFLTSAAPRPVPAASTAAPPEAEAEEAEDNDDADAIDALPDVPSDP